MRLKNLHALLAAVVFFTAGCSSNRNSTSVGAIRWDGWFPGSSWAKNLEPAEYHYRLPFYTTWQNDKPIINGDTQEVMDKEIGFAKTAGIGYWAFVYYYPTSWPEADKYNYGLKRYLASKYKNDVKFCLILQGGHLGPKTDWPDTAQKLVDFFNKPTYQKVLGNRPLVYMFYVHEFNRIFGPNGVAKDALRYLRNKTVESGLGEPYIVAQVFDANEGAGYVDGLGFDAISAYSKQNDPNYSEQREYPYSALAKINMDYWEACKNLNKDVVPIVNAGWDVRPRWWDTELMKAYNGQHRPYFAQPTPTELADHVKDAIRWNKDNSTVAKANTILIYSWDEFDEGGWLAPTEAEGTERLDALKGVLKKQWPY
jgi:hypothetical protein